MKIDRAAVLDELDAFAREGSGVVVGPPGVGKSYLLRQLNERLADEKSPHLFIPVDQLGTGTQPEITAWLGSDPTSLLAELVNESGNKRGMVVFDAFDAARSEESRVRVLALIRATIDQVGHVWSVIVTVRTYDASRSKALIRLFSSDDTGFDGLRKYFVPALTDAEVDQAVSQIPGLAAVLKDAGREFRGLLHTPFNLWLAERMLANVPDASELSGIRSEVQLLEAFWRRRVSTTTDAEDREAILLTVVTEMVKRRAVAVPRPSVYSAGASVPWTALLSNEILRLDEQKQGVPPTVSFSHNILFDYAVSVLAIGNTPSDFVGFVSADASRPLFLQPSLAYYLARAWYYEGDKFWQLAKSIHKSVSLPVRVFARLVPPLTVVREARTRDELQPLVRAFTSDQDFAQEFSLRLFQALRIESRARAALWTSFAADLSARLDRHFAWDLVTYTAAAVDTKGPIDTDVRDNAGLVARRACTWVLDQRKESENQWLSVLGASWVVPLVVRTATTAPKESADLLRKVLAIADEPGFPVQYLYQLSNEIEKIAALDAHLARAIYARVFLKDEESTAETQFGTPVLPLRSTRRQDYGMCRYMLAKSYPAFLRIDFATAAAAGIEVVNAHVFRNRIIGEKPSIVTFDYRGRKARYRPDYSYIWGDGRYHEEALEIADHLFTHIGERASEGDVETLTRFLDLLAEHAEVAFLWRELLQLAARRPAVVVPQIKELLLSRAILLSGETQPQAGDVLAAAGSALASQDWQSIETCVTTLPFRQRGKKRDWATHVRKRLLVSIPEERLSDAKVRKERRALLSEGVKNDALARTTTSWGKFTHRDWLEEEGVAIKAPENEPLLDLRDDLEQRTAPWTNKAITLDAARDFLALADQSIRALAANRDAAELVREGVWTQIGKCLTFTALRAKDLTEDERQRLRERLLTALGDEITTEETDAAFDFPAWSPTRVTESTRGIVYLGAASDFQDILETLEKLASQGSNVVRFLAVGELWRVYKRHPRLFWGIMDARLNAETKRAIRDALFKTLYGLPGSASPEIAIRAAAQFEREREESETAKEASSYGLLLTWLGLRREEPSAVRLMDRLLTEAELSPKLSRSVMRASVDTITPAVLADADRAFIARNAGKYVSRGIKEVRRALLSLLEKVDQGRDEQVHELYSVLDDTTHVLRANLRRKESDERPDLDSVAEFYEIVKPILAEVVAFGHEPRGVIHAATAHRLMEFFNVLLPADPVGILHLATETAVAGERTGYSLDGMAVREVVDMVKELLADYRLQLQEPGATDDLLRLLDVFGRAGWPEALQLVLRLDEVFR